MHYIIKVMFKKVAQLKRRFQSPQMPVFPSFATGGPVLPAGCQPGPQAGSVPLCQVPSAGALVSMGA